MSRAIAKDERHALHAVAELVGRLLLREVDAGLLTRLRAPELSPMLTELGIQLPEPHEQEAWLEERAADYHELFLRPETGPLVQSLWTEGRYEGDAAVRARQLAQHAGVEFQRDAARGAAVDHLGSLLLLWRATDGEVQEVADEVASKHLDWALVPLARTASAAGFYGAVASLARRLTRELAVS